MARRIFGVLFAHAHASAGAQSVVLDRPVSQGWERVAKKHVTPKWVDRLLIAVIIAIPVLYTLGVSFEVGPSMNHLGLIYVVKWGSLPTQPGQIVRLAPAELPTWRKYVFGSTVKRVTGFTPDGLITYEGDNSEWSSDSRDGLKPVPPDHVAGVIVAAFSPRRFARLFTTEGRWVNRLELLYAPKDLTWASDHTKVAINTGNGVAVMSQYDTICVIEKANGPRWKSNALIEVSLVGMAGFATIDTKTGQIERTVAPKLRLPARVRVQARIGKTLSIKMWLVFYNLPDEVEVVWNKKAVRVKPLRLPHLNNNTGPPVSMFGFIWGPKTMEAEFLIRPVSG